jgi:predicted nucleic acid-binding protein
LSYAVLDTDGASRILKHDLPSAAASRLAGQPLCITFITLGELTQWATMRAWGRVRREALGRWVSEQPVLPGSEDVARRWGEISARARQRGRPRPANDTWIAACCLVYDLPLATFNAADFGDFVEHEGLRLVLDQGNSANR